jgi:hypothetical protein
LHGYKQPPKRFPGFPNAEPRTPKTLISNGGGLRKRWKDPDGTIYEWDYLHGSVEKFDKRGKHLGEFNFRTGIKLKGPDPKRKIVP